MKDAAFMVTCLLVVTVCQARIITVDDDGPADFNNIQAAIDTAVDGDAVILADGTYTGDGNRDIDFRGKAITVRSENGPEQTIIDCENDGRGFHFQNGETLSSRLEGITIYRGNERKGCSIYIVNSSPKISNCLIKDSSRFDGHGAIFCDNNSSAEIIDCVFDNNNMANGSGIKCERGGDIEIRGCEFYRGADSAIYCEYDVKVTIENCIIMDTNGTAPYHAPPAIYLVEIDNASIITNCIIANNHSTRWAAGIWCIRSNPTITNCIIVGNSSNEPGGGIGCYDADPVISNCIIWGNQPPSGPQIVLKAGSKPSITYCDVQGGWPGEGNIDVDPCFADSKNGDYHLKSQGGHWDVNSESWVKDEVTSPCVDAGDVSTPVGHEPFPNGGVVNMGAYGGTAEASKSYFGGPVCETIVAGDINGDCKVDFADLGLMALHWLEERR